MCGHSGCTASPFRQSSCCVVHSPQSCWTWQPGDDPDPLLSCVGVVATASDIETWLGRMCELLTDQTRPAHGNDRILIRDTHVQGLLVVKDLPVSVVLKRVTCSDSIRVSCAPTVSVQDVSGVPIWIDAPRGGEVRVDQVDAPWLVLADERGERVRMTDSAGLNLRWACHCAGPMASATDTPANPEGRDDSLSISGEMAALRLVGGAYGYLSLNDVTGLKQLDVVSVAVRDRLVLEIPQKLVSVRLLNCSVGHLSATGLSAQHVLVEYSRLDSIHLRAHLIDSILVEGAEIHNDCQVSGDIRRSFIGATTMFGRMVWAMEDGADAQREVTMSGSTFHGPCAVSGCDRLILDECITRAVAFWGDSSRPLALTAAGWTAAGKARLVLAGGNISLLTDWRAEAPVDIELSRPPHSSSPTTLKVVDAQLGHLRIHAAPGTGLSPTVSILPPLSASEIVLEGLDLKHQAFAEIPTNSVRIGQGNSFTRSAHRAQLRDELASAPAQQRAHAYASLRLGLDKGADATLANDFYIGEMKAREAYEQGLQKWVLRLYGLLGGWGVRPWRPFCALLVVLTAGFGAGVRTHQIQHPAGWAEAFAQFLAQAVPGVSHATPPSSSSIAASFQLVLIVIKILVTVLAGFWALGLRNKVRR